MLAKSLAYGADALVWDLEDGVPPAEKANARLTIRRALDALPPGSPVIWVRVNSVVAGMLDADLEAVVHPNLHGVLLSKAESAGQMQQLDTGLASWEKKLGVAAGAVRTHAILETATGVASAQTIAGASSRIEGISLGAEDFTLDLGTSRSKAGVELMHARGCIVLAAAVARVQAVDTVFSDLQDEEGLANESRLARQLGFRGKFAVHPKQVPAINAAFSPSEAELAFARKVVAAFAEAQIGPAGVIVVDGKMVDLPVAERARRLLDT
jgi:citrate lyase subunit beta/citryl-CoA lyase